MSEQEKNEATEELIKATAKNLFFKEGKFNATTQEIADAAGVNRTLINYYFRSRDNLFNMIFEDAIRAEEKQRETVLYSDLPFKQKMENYLEDALRVGQEFPYLETYIVTKMNEGCFYKEEEDWERFQAKFKAELDEEIEKGNIEKIDPIQFILNIASLVSFPIALKPLFQATLKLSDQDYERILKERKDVIMKLLFKN